MFSINILGFVSNFSFKWDTLCRLIPSGGIDLFIPPNSVMGDTISRDTGVGFLSTRCCVRLRVSRGLLQLWRRLLVLRPFAVPLPTPCGVNIRSVWTSFQPRYNREGTVRHFVWY